MIPGLARIELSRSPPPRVLATFAVIAGPQRDQKAADRLLADVEAEGFQASPVYGAGGYEIRVPGLPDRAAADKVRAALVAAGLVVAEVREIGRDIASAEAPLRAQVLEVEPGSIAVQVAHARDAAIGLETTRDLARRRGAIAAVNGGFFRVSGILAGESEGVLKIDGRLLSEPDRGRAGVGFFDEAGRVGAVFGRLGFCAEARLASGSGVAIDGINRERKPGEVVLYTPELHRTTLTDPSGTEVLVSGGKVIEIRRGAGSSTIPATGFVLSFAGDAGAAFEIGDPVELETRLVPRSGEGAELWSSAHSALGAGPLLLRGGRRVARPELESISRVFTEARHPRTAAAARADGTLLFVTVDGRNPDWSVGMSLPELTDLLLELGAVDAVNLDGGGSTTMVVRGESVNRPSDPAGDRANGDAILLFPRSAAR